MLCIGVTDDVLIAPMLASEGAVGVTFDDLFAAEYPTVAGYCRRLVGDTDLAHDLAMEAFARLLARWVGVREPRRYLYRVATNLARREWRAAARRPAGEAAEVGFDPTAALAVRLAVARLPARLREVVVLYYFAGLDVAAVAALVGRSAGTVKSQLSDARHRLAPILEDV